MPGMEDEAEVGGLEMRETMKRVKGKVVIVGIVN